jgi:hypothetical protein
MKQIFKTIKATCSIIFLILLCPRAFSQEAPADPTDQIMEFNVKIDKLGDAQWEISTKMTQSQWEGFKQGPLVNDPSISKRDMERNMSTFVIENFQRDIDDMNRTVKMTCKVKAFAQYMGDGKWQLGLDSKNPQVTKLADNSYMITSNSYTNGALVQQIFKVFFPDNASNIQQSTDSFNKAIFTYNSGGGFWSYFTWNGILGVLLIVAAVVLFVKLPKDSMGMGTNKQIANT